jgi:hypothetical protein
MACSENPVEKVHENHVEPVGFQIKYNEEILIDHPDNSLVVSDSISIFVNDTAEFELFFYDEDGNLFNPLHHDEDGHEDHEEEELSLSFVFVENGLEKSTSDYVSIAVEDEHDHEGEEEHEEDVEPNHLEVVGKSVGNTKIKILILHGDHPDFESTPIKFVVKNIAVIK